MSLPIDSVWSLYLATRLHYLHGYDAMKYKGKLKNNQKRQERPDKILVRNSLMDLPDKRDVVEYCVANFLYENDNFLYESNHNADCFYSRWNKYWKGALYHLRSDISAIELRMMTKDISLQEYFATCLYDDVLMNKIQRESVCIIAHQIPSCLPLVQGFDVQRFKDRISKTIPFIQRRVSDIDFDIEGYFK